MLATFKNKTVTLLRLTTTSGDKKALSTVYTSLECDIQNIDNIQAHISEGIASKNYMAWFDPEEDVQEGDILRDEGNNRQYKAIGVERKGQGMGLMAEHLEVVLTRYNF
jgi:hypothetical protein